jgi:gliding motility-associated-like protein
LIIVAVTAFLTGKAQVILSTVETGGVYTATARDAANNVYATKLNSNTNMYDVVKFTGGTGTPTVIFSGLSHGRAIQGDNPWGLAVNSNGDVFVLNSFEMGNGQIIKLASPSYIPIVVQLGRYFSAITVDKYNYLYAIEYNSSTAKFDVVRYFPGAENSPGTIIYDGLSVPATGTSYPWGLATDSYNNVYITDFMESAAHPAGALMKLTYPTYAVSTLATGKEFSAIALDGGNNLYTIEAVRKGKAAIVKYPYPSGANTILDSSLTISGVGYPTGLTVNSNGVIYATDPFASGNGRLVRLAEAKVLSVTRNGATPTNESAATYTVVFNTSVSGVTTNAFGVSTSGLTGAGVTSVTQVDATTYTVTVNTGTGDGAMYLVVGGAGITPALVNVPFPSGDIITVDKTPSAISLAINSGVTVTNETAVTLSATATDASTPLQMRFSADSSNWSTYETFAASKSYTLGTGDGVKKVYMQVKDNAGNVSGTSASITLDQAAPTVTITGKPGDPSNQSSPTFSFEANETVNSFAASIDGAPFTTATSPLTLSGLPAGMHTVQIRATDPANNTGLPASYSWNIDLTSPVIQNVSAPASGTYYIGQVISLTVINSEPVYSDNAGTGLPYIDLTIGTTSRKAVYASGAGTNQWTFTYTIQEGDLDNDGIELGASIRVNNNALTDQAGNLLDSSFASGATGIRVDGIRPVATLIAPAASNETTMTVTLNFDKSVSGVNASSFSLSGIAGAAVTAVSPGAGYTSSYTISISVPANSKGTLHIAFNADAAAAYQSGNTNAATAVDVDYDNTAPVITGVSVPANAYYKAVTTLEFTVSFDKNITVSTAAGDLYLPLTIGSSVVHAAYVNGSGTKDLTFSYTVVAGDNDNNGIALGTALTADAGTLKDSYGNEAVTTINGAGNTNGVLVNTIIPTVVLSTGSSFVNSVFYVTATFSEPVTGLTADDFTISNGTVSGVTTTDNIVYTIEVTPSVNGTVSIQLPADASVNIGDNGNSVSNELQVTADFTPPVIVRVDGPADGYYHAGDQLKFVVHFSEELAFNITTEQPYMALNLNSGVMPVYYTGRDSTNGMVFTYTVADGDDDGDGIEMGAGIALSNLLLTDKAGNPALVYINPAPAFPGVKVNTTHTSVTLSAATMVNAAYQVTATFAEAVRGLSASDFTVINGTASDVQTTDSIVYTVTITPLTDGTVSVSLPANAAVNIARNGNAASNTLSTQADLTAPVVTGGTVPAAGYNKSGAVLNFAVTFNEAVNVSGTPRLAIAMGSSTVYANYSSGTGTATLHFSYTVVNGDQDLDGIAVDALLDGVIKDAAGNDAVRTLAGISPVGVLVNTVAPVITQVNVPANGYYNATQTLNFSVGFNSVVKVTGSPVLSLTIGSAVVNAAYTGGTGTNTLTFSYAIQPGENDLDGIVLSALTGSIQDLYGNDAVLTLNNAGSTAGVYVYTDKSTAVLSSVSTLVNSAFEVTATFNEKVSGLSAADFTIGNGTASNLHTSDNITYTFTVTPMADGNVTITLPADMAVNIGDNGNTATNTLTVVADVTAPIVTSIAVPANDYYKAGDVLNFEVRFGEAVTVTGTPRIAITMGSSTVYADYAGGTGTSALSFSYTVVSGDQDLDGIVIGALGSGTIKDAAENSAVLTFVAPATTGVLVNTIAPLITRVNVPANAYYHAAQSLNFSVQFDGIVNVTGIPVLPVTIGNTTVNATYRGGTGTNTLSFSYTVLDGENDLDGISLAAITGTIQDLFGNEAEKTLNNVGSTAGVLVYTVHAGVTLSTPATLVKEAFVVSVSFSEAVSGLTATDFTVSNGTAGNLQTSDNITYNVTITPASDGNVTVSLPQDVTINKGDNGNTASNTLTVLADLTAPAVTTVSVPANGYYKAGDVLNFALTFGEVVNVSGTPRIAITMGSNTVYADYTSGSGTSTLNFTYTVVNGDQDLDGIAVGTLDYGTIKDAAGNNAVLTFTAPATTGVLVNTIAPVITQVGVPANAYYHATQTLDFTVQLNAVVNVTGTPVLPITIGNTTVNAAYTGGTGSTTLSFSYTVQDGDNDLDGIAIADISGTIQDAFGNNAMGTLHNAGSTAGVYVYTIHPTVTLDNAPSLVNGAFNATATFSEAVTGLTAADFSVTNGTASNLQTSNNITYTVTITPAADGNVTINLPADAAVNIGDNGNSASNTLTIVSDVTAPVIANGQTFTINEYSAAGTSLGSVTATDATGTLQNWTITNDPSGAFAINAATGELSVKDEAALNASIHTTVSLTITVSDGLNVSNANTVAVTVVYVPLPPTDINLDNNTIVENTPVNTLVGHLSAVTAEPNPVYTYTLVTGTGSTDNTSFTISGNQLLSAAVLDYAVKNLYYVRIRATLGNGLYTEKSFTVQLGQVNQAPTLDPVADQEVCDITTAQQIQTSGASAVEDGQTLSYTVRADQPFFSSLLVNANGLITYRLNPGISGTVHVTVTVKDNGGTAYGGVDTLAQTFAIKVNALPKITITADQDTVISKGTAMNLTATGGNSYEWLNASGIVSGQQTETLQIKPVENTVYTVTVTDNNGCVNEGAMMITVVNEFKIDAINLLSPNGDGKNDKWIINDLSRYPNNDLTIYDRTGRVVYHTKNYSNNWDATYNGSPLAEGTYYYILKADGYNTPAKGFITIIRDQH